MIEDDKGQVSLEYLLIMSVGLILLLVFTIPLTQSTIENTLDVADVLNVKSDMVKISQAIEEVYGQGQGSKHSVNIQSGRALKINVLSNYISCNLKLKDSSSKNIKINCKSNLAKSSINLVKGDNIIVVEWPVGSENMIIYTKLF